VRGATRTFISLSGAIPHSGAAEVGGLNVGVVARLVVLFTPWGAALAVATLGY
jgi:hypothetical protein